MVSKSVVSSFPDTVTVERIKALRPATHDVSRFINMTPEEIVFDLDGKGACLRVNYSDVPEVAKFEETNALLR